MSNTTHTPGAWGVDLETGEITAADGQIVIGTIYGADHYPCLDEDDDEGVQGWGEECRANALLIAAAPDLLAVAIDIKKYLDFVSSGQPTHGTVERELYYRLQAAIAAAKGEK